MPLKHGAIVMLVGLLGAPVRAQVPPLAPAPLQFWNQTEIISAQLESPIKITLESKTAKSRTLELPTKAIGYEFYDGIHWIYQREQHENKKFINLYASKDCKTWERMAFFEIKNHFFPSWIRPLPNDAFLVGFFSPIYDGNRYGLFAIARKNSHGELQIQSVVDLNLQFDLLSDEAKSKRPARLTLEDLRPSYKSLAMLATAPAYRVHDYIIFSMPQQGRFWIFDGKRQTIARTVDLNPFLDEARFSEVDRLPWCVLGCQPTPDGRLLIATRDPQALAAETETSLAPAIRTVHDFMNESLQEAAKRALAISLKLHPDIAWWTLDPETGRLQREEPPTSFIQRFEGVKDYLRFNFRFKPDGNLASDR